MSKARFYVAKCDDGDSIQGAKKPWSWDVVDRIDGGTASNHQSRILARAEAAELNACEKCIKYGAYRDCSPTGALTFHSHDHDSSAAGSQQKGAGVPPT